MTDKRKTIDNNLNVNNDSNVESKHKNVNNVTILINACQYNNENEIINLINQGQDVNQEDENENTPLIISSEKNNFDIVKFLIENKANINKHNKDGETPLIKACKNNNLRIIKYLIEKGANINKQNKKDGTPLIIAFKNNNIKLVKYLIKKGADIKIKNGDGETILTLVCRNNNENILKFIYEHFIYKIQYIINLLFHYKNQIFLSDSALENTIFEDKSMIARNVTIEYTDGNSSLFIALKNKSDKTETIIHYLVDMGMDVNKKNKDSCTPLNLECEEKIQMKI